MIYIALLRGKGGGGVGGFLKEQSDPVELGSRSTTTIEGRTAASSKLYIRTILQNTKQAEIEIREANRRKSASVKITNRTGR